MAAESAGEFLSKSFDEFSGVVVGVETRCLDDANKRCYSTYFLREDNGETYKVGGGMAYIGVNMGIPVGTHLYKEKGKLHYFVDGERVGLNLRNDFSGILGGILVFISLALLRKDFLKLKELKRRSNI